MSRVFSGIQPTGGGVPHLGNYLGALRNYVDLQAGNQALYCVVDLHATTQPYDPKVLGLHSRTTAAAMLACGVDPAQATLFRQSAVAEHSALALVLGHIASLGPLERMTQFKDKGRLSEGSERDSIGFGLLSYPVLMAADILLYHAELVPVGDDQHQHLQLCAELARRFNKRFGADTFAPPRRIHQMGAERIMSLRDPVRKMSKSDPDPMGMVLLTDSADVARRKYRMAVTDSSGQDSSIPGEAAGLEGRVATANLVGLLAALERSTPDAVCARLAGGGFGTLKAALVDAHVEHIVPIGQRMGALLDEPGHASVRAVLEDGAARARAVARATMAEVNALVGFSD